ncbi:MAG TPA: AzlD domain-containing protein [Oceanospirillaceae bacterium]|nr:AzlD domain-containing protein [Oceanospirillaceae bacterium]
MNETLMIAGMALVTFSVRYVMFAMAGRIRFPLWLNQSLNFVPPVVLTAIIAPLILMPNGQLDVSFANPYFWAALIAGVIGFWRQHLLTTIVVGMLSFVIFKWMMS